MFFVFVDFMIFFCFFHNCLVVKKNVIKNHRVVKV